MTESHPGTSSAGHPEVSLEAAFDRLNERFSDVIVARDRLARLLNRLENAITHHQNAHMPKGVCFVDTPDEALWKARDKICTDWHEGKG